MIALAADGIEAASSDAPFQGRIDAPLASPIAVTTPRVIRTSLKSMATRASARRNTAGGSERGRPSAGP